MQSLLQYHPNCFFFLQKPGGFKLSALAWVDLEPLIVRYVSDLRAEKTKTVIPGEPKVSVSLGNHRILVFRQKNLNQIRGMCWSIVVLEASLTCWAQLRSLTPHSVMLATEDIPVVLFGDCLILCCVLVMYNDNPTWALNITSVNCCLP